MLGVKCQIELPENRRHRMAATGREATDLSSDSSLESGH
jgi:hypothetical protein